VICFLCHCECDAAISRCVIARSTKCDVEILSLRAFLRNAWQPLATYCCHCEERSDAAISRCVIARSTKCDAAISRCVIARSTKCDVEILSLRAFLRNAWQPHATHCVIARSTKCYSHFS